MVKNSSGKTDLRSFTVIDVGKHGGCKTKFKGGRYLGRNPAAAAKKAFSEFCRTKRIRGVCSLIVTVEETTQGSKKKQFSYKLNRRKLKEPVIRLEGTDNEYVIEYETKGKAVNVPVACRKPGQSRGRPMKKSSRKNKSSANNVRRLKVKSKRR